MYNRREKKENIKLGYPRNYYYAERIAENFEKFIDDTITELFCFPVTELQEKGIRLTKGYGSWIVDFTTTDGISFKIMRFKDNSSTSYRVTQQVKAKSMKAINSLPVVNKTKSVMTYSSRIHPVEAGYKDREFNFDGEEKTDGSVVNYVDGFLLSPAKAVLYFEPNQQYYSYSHRKPYPKPVFKKLKNGDNKLIRYVNQDGSKAESKPFIATTYPSFEEGQADMTAKLEAFKETLKKVLADLNEATSRKGIEYIIGKNND